MPPKYRTFYSGSRHQPIGSDNIGHKMLEKMGWSSGLGLGKHNQGSPESLQIRHKVDTYGLRCKNETARSLPHQTAFEDLLGELSSSSKERGIDCNAPLETKIFRRRPWFTKVAKAKDVANYAEKDLQGILGSCAKSMCANKSEAPQGSLPKNTDLCRKNSQIGCENELDKINVPQSFEVSEIGCDPSFNVSSKKVSKKKGKKVWRKFDLETFREIETDSYSSEHNAYETKDCTSFTKWGKRKKRKQNLDACKNLLCCGERSEASNNSHIVDSESNTSSAKSNNYIEDFRLTDSKEKNKSFECVDAKNSGKLNSSFIDTSIAEEETEICNDMKLEKPRQSKINIKGDKTRNNEEDSSTDESVSQSPVATRPAGNSYRSYEDDEEEKRWKVKVLNDPALLAEICSGFVGANLHKIKGYGNW